MRNIKLGTLVCVMLICCLTPLVACDNNSLSGTWEATERNEALSFSGSSYTWTMKGKIDNKGTYSISGDQIEFDSEEYGIYVMSYSRTDNTITLSNAPYGTATFIRNR